MVLSSGPRPNTPYSKIKAGHHLRPNPLNAYPRGPGVAKIMNCTTGWPSVHASGTTSGRRSEAS
eukprot:11180887-Lingulodinium_polyedra.AAC.1